MRSALLLALILFSTTGRGGDPPSPGLAEASAGARVYQTHCASCHGRQGEGAPGWQTPNDAGEMPPPPHDRDGHTWKHADGMLFRIVRDGWRDPFNKTARLSMPAFGQHLSDAEIRAVIDDLKVRWTPEQRRFQAEESRHHPFPPAAP